MVIIGVDPHKRTHTASAMAPEGSRVLATMQIDASLSGYRRLLAWAAGFGQHRWAVENAQGLGRHLAQWLLARGEVVEDVPSTATARVRAVYRGGRRKNDVIDAAAAASVVALHGEANPVVAEDLTTVLALLDERRDNVITQRTRLINQLHALRLSAAVHLALVVDGERLHFTVHGAAPEWLTATGDAFLAALLMPAMALGEKLESKCRSHPDCAGQREPSWTSTPVTATA